MGKPKMIEIKCVYPNGKWELTKRDIEGIKAFGKVVRNYLKIKRIECL